jgi:hypothetical protein
MHLSAPYLFFYLSIARWFYCMVNGEALRLNGLNFKLAVAYGSLTIYSCYANIDMFINY